MTFIILVLFEKIVRHLAEKQKLSSSHQRYTSLLRIYGRRTSGSLEGSAGKIVCANGVSH
ncbi:MAG TPA: hypothetical protein VEX65_13420 [Flavisolibacter sp.]|jgi:hypothetical protein|nr:hypothetical protein [Flavisolibacter sp.]